MKKILLALALFLLPISAEAANRFAICTTTCTWDGASTAMWSTSTGGATGASVPGSADAVILDAATCVGGTTCTVTVNTTVTVQSITMGACTASTTGCILDFSVNNNNATLTTQFSSTGSGTRNLKLGSGTFTMNANQGVVWDFGTTTNLTLTGGTATLLFNGSPAAGATVRQINLCGSAGITYPTITVTNSGSGGAYTIVSWNAAVTIGTLNFTGPMAARMDATGTMTISTGLNWSGASLSSLALVIANPATAVTISVPASQTITWAAIEGITFTTNPISPTNTIDLRSNNVNGGTISPPATGGGGRIIGG